MSLFKFFEKNNAENQQTALRSTGPAREIVMNFPQTADIFEFVYESWNSQKVLAVSILGHIFTNREINQQN
ncbi:1922_t:CDS:2 [Dentiscutata erythropus]|uniref:1922_t:CDS:1 n=1 Tax=Dentiscutata erythropus TaxID=1348616 RepID=A0A9N8ZUM5_9GLOM|nr:1922_t:CDS:2 [Dentiscutata erythropus]